MSISGRTLVSLRHQEALGGPGCPSLLLAPQERLRGGALRCPALVPAPAPAWSRGPEPPAPGGRCGHTDRLRRSGVSHPSKSWGCQAKLGFGTQRTAARAAPQRRGFQSTSTPTPARSLRTE